MNRRTERDTVYFVPGDLGKLAEDVVTGFIPRAFLLGPNPESGSSFDPESSFHPPSIMKSSSRSSSGDIFLEGDTVSHENAEEGYCSFFFPVLPCGHCVPGVCGPFPDLDDLDFFFPPFPNL